MNADTSVDTNEEHEPVPRIRNLRFRLPRRLFHGDGKAHINMWGSSYIESDQMLIHPLIEEVFGGGTLIPRCRGEDSQLARNRSKVRRKVRTCEPEKSKEG